MNDPLAKYPLLSALNGRRSRRFGVGMKMTDGPLAYQSHHHALPLTKIEEAALAFAACGITGRALADLTYGEGQGGSIMAGLLGRTVSSGDAIQAVVLVVTNDEATYLLKRPQDFPSTEISDLIQLAQSCAFTELYDRSRIKIQDGRTAPPLHPLFNLNVNKWSLHSPGTTYFLPINEMTFMYINGLLEIFNEATGCFVLDERAQFRPAGIGRFALRKGGHLVDDPSAGRVTTVQRIELLLAELVTVEQGMMLQNLGLMTQAMGLGGFPNFAAHEFGWFEALGFRMGEMPASRYLGANRLITLVQTLLGRDQPVPYALGLERDGAVLLKPYCPPYFPSMKAAVQAVVEAKFGAQGFFRCDANQSAWRDPGSISAEIPALSEAAIDATTAYCEYLYQQYGRFPAYVAPFRTVIGYQALHIDVDFYDRFYKPEALTDTQRQHLADWHR